MRDEVADNRECGAHHTTGPAAGKAAHCTTLRLWSIILVRPSSSGPLMAHFWLLRLKLALVELGRERLEGLVVLGQP